MKYSIVLTILISLFMTGIVVGQTENGSTLDDVHLFQTFFRDASTSQVPYGEGGLIYSDYDAFSSFQLGAQGSMPVTPQIEAGARLAFVSLSPEVGDGESGLSDLWLSGKYNITPGPTKFSAGGYLTLPIGEEKVFEGNLNFGAFGAVRHALETLVITGVVGLDFVEVKKTTYNPATNEVEEESDYENSLLIGGGVIYPANEQLNVVGELNIQTEGDYAMLSGGVDYALKANNRLRAALGLGLDDGAPDISLMASFLVIL